MAIGRVIKFDEVRGYGFIAPIEGGEDIFLHVNDLLVPESFIRSRALVEFERVDGERGPKAAAVRLARDTSAVAAPEAPLSGSSTAAPVSHAAPATVDDEPLEDYDDTLCDVLSEGEFLSAVTELLLAASPSLTGEQILQIRGRLVAFGKSRGWVES